MNEVIALHNSHWEDAKRFSVLDPQLRRLKKEPFQYHHALLDALPLDIPGIYTVGGGRQVGKTTLLKQWMQQLLQSGVDPQAILFLTGEVIDDHHELIKIMMRELAKMPKVKMRYVLIDEVTYITQWDKGVKFLSDAGLFDDVELVLTGSDLVIMKQARMTFPGRRGKADKADFHIYPLSFYDVVKLKGHIKSLDQKLEEGLLPSSVDAKKIADLFEGYLAHGGYLVAINDLEKHQRIMPATFQTYAEWIRGDVLKRHKQEHYLQEVVAAILKSYGSQVTWNSLAQTLSVEHPQTLADYVELLQSMDAVFIQHALLEDKLVGAPKKAKKVLLSDPFVYHALNNWLNPSDDPYQNVVLPMLQNPERISFLVETVVVNHFRRYYPTYYIKATGEVDVAYVNKNKFWPIELKWTGQLRSKDLKQVVKYKNAEIWAKIVGEGEIQGVPVYNLPWRLLQLSKQCESA